MCTEELKQIFVLPKRCPVAVYIRFWGSFFSICRIGWTHDGSPAINSILAGQDHEQCLTTGMRIKTQK